MKKVTLKVYVLNIHSDGDTYSYLYASRDEAIEHLYSQVSDDWENMFDEEDIDDYSHEGAVDHYYEYSDGGYYSLELETVSFPLMELQDMIAKAIGLATHG